MRRSYSAPRNSKLVLILHFGRAEGRGPQELLPSYSLYIHLIPQDSTEETLGSSLQLILNPSIDSDDELSLQLYKSLRGFSFSLRSFLEMHNEILNSKLFAAI